MSLRSALGTLASLACATALSATVSTSFAAEAGAESPLDDTMLLSKIQRYWPQIKPTHVQPAPVPGVTEMVILPANTVLYVDNQGQWVIQGTMFHLGDGGNLSQQALARARREALQQLPALDYFHFAADEERHRLTVVTDIDCPYCRQLHQEIGALNEAGVSVRYIMLPRAGLESAAYDKAVNAACADRPESALTRSFLGETLPPGQCQHSIAQQWQLAHELGASLTPLIIDEGSGRSWPGYPGLQALIDALK